MNKKKIILGVMITCFALILGLNLNTNTKTASALTQKQVKTKIRTLKKDIKRLKKKQKKALAVEKKQKKGTKYIFGTRICKNPFIVEVKPLIGHNSSYYWVKNSKYMSDALILAGGHIKLTGKYKKYNGYTCAVVKAVKVSNKSAAYRKKIIKKEDALYDYQCSLKEQIVFNENTYNVYVTEKKSLGKYWKYSGKYNKATLKSSNPSIATVEQNGIVTGKKAGTVTISATCSLSKKTTQCKVIVKNKETEDNNNNGNDDYGNNDENDGNDTDNDDYDSSYYINIIQNCYLPSTEYLIIDTAFSKFFSNQKWNYYKSNDKKHIVEFSGNFVDETSNIKTAHIQFIVENSEYSNAYIKYLDIDGIVQNETATDSFFETICNFYFYDGYENNDNENNNDDENYDDNYDE